MRRRGNLGKEENLRIRTEGPRASGDGEGDRGGQRCARPILCAGPWQRTTKQGRKRGGQKNKQRGKKKTQSRCIFSRKPWIIFFFFSPPFQIHFAFFVCFSSLPLPQKAWPDTLSILMIIFRNSEYIFFLSFLLSLAGRGRRRSAGPARGSKQAGELGERQGEQPGTAASPPRAVVAVVHCTGAFPGCQSGCCLFVEDHAGIGVP